MSPRNKITDFTMGEDKIWLYSMQADPLVGFRHKDTNGNHIVDATELGRVRWSRYGQEEFVAFMSLENYTETLEESDFLLDGGDLLLVRWPDVT